MLELTSNFAPWAKALLYPTARHKIGI